MSTFSTPPGRNPRLGPQPVLALKRARPSQKLGTNRLLRLARMLCVFLGCFLLWNCSGRKAVFLEKPPAAIAQADTARLYAEAEVLWQKRDDRKTAYDALYAYQRAFAANPRNSKIGARLAQAYAFVGYYIATTEEEQDTLYYRGLEIGERTLALHEPFRMAYMRRQEEEKALGKIVYQLQNDKRNNRAPQSAHWLAAIYWTGVNLERWSDLQNSLRRLGNKKRIEVYKRAVLQVDEAYDYGGVYRSTRVVPMKPPYFGATSLQEGFERALAIAPNYFANRTTYARFYALPHNQPDLFNEQLDYVLNGEPNILPEAYAENKYEREIAARMREQAAQDFAELQRKEAEKEKKKREYKPRY